MERFGEDAQTHEKGENANGYIDIKDPAPGEILSDQTSKGRPQADAKCYDDRVQTERPPALIRRENTCDHRNIHSKDQCSPQSLEEPGQDQNGQGRCRSAKNRTKHKKQQPQLIEWFASDYIGQASEREQNRSDDKQIADDDPL